MNVFRWSVDNCAFNLYRTIDPSGNVYGVPEGQWGDELVQLWALQDFTRGLDSRATIMHLGIANPALVRGYALRSPTTYAAYLHAYTDHTNPTTVDPLAGGTATWIDPATGAILASQSVSAGAQTLTVPAFTTDVALKIAAS